MALTKIDTPAETVTKTSIRKSFISPDDVLMGRGARATENEGNVRFRQIVRSRLRDYLTAPRRQEKDQIAREILAIVKSRNGRFLRKVESMDESQEGSDYVSVEDEVALLKVKQALRDQKLEEANTASTASDSSVDASQKSATNEKSGLGKASLPSVLLTPTTLHSAIGSTSDALLLQCLKDQARAAALDNMMYPGLAQSGGLAAARLALAEREINREALLRAALLKQSQAALGLGSLNPTPGLLALETEARLRLAQQASVQDLLLRSSANVRAGGFQELGDVTSAQRLLKRQKI